MTRRIRPLFSPYSTVLFDGAAFTIGAEAGNIKNVAVQLQSGRNLAERGALQAYLAADANGDTLANVGPSGGVAIGTNGLLLSPANLPRNGLTTNGTLAIDAVPEKFKTTSVLNYVINGVQYTKAATTALVFTAAHVVTATKFGVVLIQIDAAGTISTKVVATPQAYDSAALALVAKPAPDAGNVEVGYLAVANNAVDWTANTDDLTDGSDLTTAEFVNGIDLVNESPRFFWIVSEANGLFDLNLTETGAGTWYLVLIMPSGELVVSSAITFV